MIRPPAKYAPFARRVAGNAGIAALLAFCFVSSLLLVARELPRLFLLNEAGNEAGYGDSYVLYDALHFQKTGVIYRDLSQPPYLPAQYSPLVYMLYSVPGRIATGENPFFGPRLVALAAFLLCVAVVVSIVRTLIPARYTWIWGVLLVGSIACMQEWVLQLRGDFPGIFFNLLAIRLLMSRSRYAVLLAGVSAGLATEFKFILVAALAAGCVWLLLRRRWKDLVRFAAAGALTSFGLYLLFWLREPRMISQMFAVSPGIPELPGYFKLIFKMLAEPVILLAMLAIPPLAARSGPRWNLLLLFALASFAIAALTDVQAGGNINYFFECLFALTPLAVLGVLRFIAWARTHLAIGLFLAVLSLFHFFQPIVRGVDSSTLKSRIGPRGVSAENNTFRTLEHALSGHRIFSTVPRMALLDPQPALLEPYLLNYLQREGKFNPDPVFRRVRNGEFDVVITAAQRQYWRGVDHIAPGLRAAIVSAYAPYCVIQGDLLQLPRNLPADSALTADLKRAGCAPVADTSW